MSDKGGQVYKILRPLIDEAAALARSANAAAALIDEAAGNYVSITDGLPTNTAAPPLAPVIVAAIIVTPKVSGIFRINARVGYSGTSAADTPAWGLLAAEQSASGVPITVASGGAPASFAGDSATAPGNVGDVSNVATGIVLAGEGAPVGLDAETIEVAPDLTTNQSQQYQVSGLFMNGHGSGAKTPFTLGETVVFYILVDNTGGPHVGGIQDMVVAFSVQEQPSA
jgi:hypothetical protein